MPSAITLPNTRTPFHQPRRAFLKGSLAAIACTTPATAPLLQLTSTHANAAQQGQPITPARPAIGMHLPLWHQNTPDPAAFWRQVCDELKAIGVTNCLILVYHFVNPETGAISDRSRFTDAVAPDLDFLSGGLKAAKDAGIAASLYPVLEIDNDNQIGAVWRGYLNFFGTTLDNFFARYNARIIELSDLAQAHDSPTVYIGSELASLTHNLAAKPHWEELIHHLRKSTSTTAKDGRFTHLTYAAHWEEYTTVPFWRQLDDIGINAYFPLASSDDATGQATPSEASLTTALQARLQSLKKFAARQKRPLIISEFGLTAYDQASARPWARQPTKDKDYIEQENTYKAMLAATAEQGDWLSAINFWHWKMPGYQGSSYNIEKNSTIAAHLKSFATTE